MDPSDRSLPEQKSVPGFLGSGTLQKIMHSERTGQTYFLEFFSGLCLSVDLPLPLFDELLPPSFEEPASAPFPAGCTEICLRSLEFASFFDVEERDSEAEEPFPDFPEEELLLAFAECPELFLSSLDVELRCPCLSWPEELPPERSLSLRTLESLCEDSFESLRAESFLPESREFFLTEALESLCAEDLRSEDAELLDECRLLRETPEYPPS